MLSQHKHRNVSASAPSNNISLRHALTDMARAQFQSTTDCSEDSWIRASCICGLNQQSKASVSDLVVLTCRQLWPFWGWTRRHELSVLVLTVGRLRMFLSVLLISIIIMTASGPKLNLLFYPTPIRSSATWEPYFVTLSISWSWLIFSGQFHQNARSFSRVTHAFSNTIRIRPIRIKIRPSTTSSYETRAFTRHASQSWYHGWPCSQ